MAFEKKGSTQDAKESGKNGMPLAKPSKGHLKSFGKKGGRFPKRHSSR